MKLLRLVAVMAGCLLGAVYLLTHSANPSKNSPELAFQACASLVGNRYGSSVIEHAEWVKQGDPLLGIIQRTTLFVATMGKVSLEAMTDYCHVTGKATPVPGSQITIGVWLPEPWNGKLLGSGGYGFNGGVSVAEFTLKNILGDGYAIMATDAGHEPTDSLRFAYGAPEALNDYGYRANQEGTQFAKLLIDEYYNKPLARSYFHGCSNGGRDALMLAQRSPELYDGIIAGAPALDFTNLMSRFAWNSTIVAGVPELGNKLPLLTDAVLKKCDALDGLRDGLLENPLNCDFDPGSLLCDHGEVEACLTAAEVSAVRKLYEGPRLSDGTSIYAGQPVGAEAMKEGWDDWILGGEHTTRGGEEIFRWLVYGNPEWTLQQFDLARDSAKAEKLFGSILNATNPDLTPFMQRGGKLLMYHGWNDVATPAGTTLDYYASVRETVGPLADTQARLFMIPGMGHCGGGIGASYFDKLAEMERWVETGVAPDRIDATEYDPPVAFSPRPNATVVRTRPLCAWPKTAHYKGSGSIDNAANFVCR